MDYAEMKTRSVERLENPQPGDYWHEMFSPVCVVLDVDPEHVTICRTVESVLEDRWTWNLNAAERLTREGFARWLTYPSDSALGTWAVVARDLHDWAVEVWRERGSVVPPAEQKRNRRMIEVP